MKLTLKTIEKEIKQNKKSEFTLDNKIMHNTTINEFKEFIHELAHKTKKVRYDRRKAQYLFNEYKIVINHNVYYSYNNIYDISENIKNIEIFAKLRKIPVALLNTSIATAPGTFELKDITLTRAKNIIKNNADNLLSAIGHDSTAQIMSELLENKIEVNRIQFEQEVEQQAIVFKLNGRPPEGAILSLEDIEKIGYKFQLLTRIN